MVRVILLVVGIGAVTSPLSAQERESKPLFKYAALGAVAGATTGALAGPLILNPACRASQKTPDKLGSCADDLFFGNVGERARAAALFAGIGAGVGLIAGAIFGRERARTVAISPAEHGVSVGVTLPF